jgi:flagellar L-ring protein precursor FlgH
MMTFIARALLILFVAFVSSGCSSFGKKMKGWMNGKDSNVAHKSVTTPKFSDSENLRAGSLAGDRQYRRMNRSRFEEEADLKADAGSLWVMEGQGAYLFSQNQMRMVGDLLNVKIEGNPKSQLQTKVKVIAKLLERLEAPPRNLASQNQAKPATPAAGAAPAQSGQPPAAGAQNPPVAGGDQANAQGAQPAAEVEKKEEPPFAVQTVPTRIVEQLKDGSYRVRGMQPFMIGKREYKVIVTGIVRAEDFDDGGLDSSKLLDPQFDIVSSKKGTM